MTKYTELTDEAEISLAASRHWLMQGVYWVLTAAIAIFDGSYAGSDPPLDVVVSYSIRQHRLAFAVEPGHGSPGRGGTDQILRAGGCHNPSLVFET